MKKIIERISAVTIGISIITTFVHFAPVIAHAEEPLTATLGVTRLIANDSGGHKQMSDFSLSVTDGTTVTPLTSGESVVLPAGSYQVLGGPHDGYAQSYAGDCSERGAITLAPGDNKFCNVADNDLDNVANVNVIVHVINNDGGILHASDVTVTATGSNVSPATFPGDESATSVILDANTNYSVDGSALTGYDKTLSAGCSDVTAGGVLSPWETRTCTITYTYGDIGSKLTVTRIIHNGNGGTRTLADFNLSISDGTTVTPLTSGVQVNLHAGSYLVDGGEHAGYAQSYAGNCREGVPMILAVGDVQYCNVYDNDYNGGVIPTTATLFVTQLVANDSGGTRTVDSFHITVTDGTTITPVISDGSVDLPPGSYQVSDGDHTGYAQSFSGNCSESGQITLVAGEIKFCNINNNDLENTDNGGGGNESTTASVGVVVHVINDDGGTLHAPDVTVTPTGTNVLPTSFTGNESSTIVTLDAGSYSIDANNVDLYDKTLSTDCSGTINAGGDKTCTITFNDHPQNNPENNDGGGNGGGGGGGGGGGVVENTITGGSGGGGGGGGGFVLGASTENIGSTTSTGEVAGVSTSICTTPYLDGYLFVSRKNPSTRVKLVQKFFGLPETGFYGPLTIAAVRNFQLQHPVDVLAPWHISESTGHVYKTTRRMIDMIMGNCTEPLPTL